MEEDVDGGLKPFAQSNVALKIDSAIEKVGENVYRAEDQKWLQFLCYCTVTTVTIDLFI